MNALKSILILYFYIIQVSCSQGTKAVLANRAPTQKAMSAKSTSSNNLEQPNNDFLQVSKQVTSALRLASVTGEAASRQLQQIQVLCQRVKRATESQKLCLQSLERANTRTRADGNPIDNSKLIVFIISFYHLFIPFDESFTMKHCHRRSN
jgi:hypothetical protein